MYTELIKKMKNYIAELNLSKYEKQNISNIFTNYLFEYRKKLMKELNDEELINWYLTAS